MCELFGGNLVLSATVGQKPNTWGQKGLLPVTAANFGCTVLAGSWGREVSSTSETLSWFLASPPCQRRRHPLGRPSAAVAAVEPIFSIFQSSKLELPVRKER